MAILFFEALPLPMRRSLRTSSGCKTIVAAVYNLKHHFTTPIKSADTWFSVLTILLCLTVSFRFAPLFDCLSKKPLNTLARFNGWRLFELRQAYPIIVFLLNRRIGLRKLLPLDRSCNVAYCFYIAGLCSG